MLSDIQTVNILRGTSNFTYQGALGLSASGQRQSAIEAMTLDVAHLLPCAMHDLIVSASQDAPVAPFAWMLLEDIRGRVAIDAINSRIDGVWAQILILL